jgi:ubiquinone/menaquinone biosynthesis C-methylase UbiE
MFYRALAAVYLFDFLDRLRALGYPANWYSILENDLDRLISSADMFDKLFDFSRNDFKFWSDENRKKDFEERTGRVYFDLWKDFGKEEFFKEALGNLKERFEKNNISVAGVNDALDDGCGSGRYSFALKSLGCAKVTGIDISPDSVELAGKMNPFSQQEVGFMQGSVLKLPFEDHSFDFVLSNGVLHHTKSTEDGIKEIHRVLRNNGACWFYLYGGKESLFWDIVDFSRKLLEGVPQIYTQSLMKSMGYPPGRIFHRTDFFYVPVNNRYFASEVELMLKSAGFNDFRRLKRGVSYDWDEIIHQNPNIDPYIFGEGEMRYMLYKKQSS